MRWSIAMVAALLVVSSLPVASAAGPAITEVRATVDGAAPGTIQLINASGGVNNDTIVFEVETPDNPSAGEIRLTPACTAVPCKTIVIPLGPGDTAGNWTASLPINDARFVATDWTVTARLISSGGVTDKSMTSALQVRAAHDASAPQLSVAGSTGGRVELGIGQSLQVTPQDPLLSLVTYDAAHIIGGPLTLKAPYRLDGSRFEEGTHQVTFKAFDRALKPTTLDMTVHKDTTDPVLTAAVASSGTYRDVPFVLVVAVDERSAHNVTVEFDGAFLYREGTGSAGTTTHTFNLEVNRTGVYDIHTVVADSLGNSADAEFNVTVIHPIADVEVVDFTVTPEYPLGGDAVDIKVEIAQDGGVKAQDVSLQLDVGSVESIIKGANLAIGQTKTVDFTVRPVVGTNTAYAALSLDDVNANETDVDDNEGNVTFEVYMGKVVYGPTNFYIRVGDEGLPTTAIDEDGNEYNLTLVQVVNGEAWQFTYEGEDLRWNPRNQTTTITPTAPPVDETAPTPGFGAVAALGVLLAAFARRRQ